MKKSSFNDYHLAGQGLLIKYIQKLGHNEQTRLGNRLMSLDILQLNQVYQNFKAKTINEQQYVTIKSCELEDKDEEIGLKMIADGKLALVISAQQNLSHIDIQLPSHKCLFQLYCERIWSLQNLAKKKFNKCCSILIFIMTTNLNHEVVVTHFQQQQYFGLRDDQIFFFQQEELPLLSLNGQLLFRKNNQLFEENIGNGQIFLSQQILDTMKYLGVNIIHLCSIENVLCKFGDPNWIGAFIRKQLYLSVKSVQKRSADEKLGIIVNVNNLGLQFKEYDDISYNDLVKKDQNGVLINQEGIIEQLMCTLEYAIELCRNYKTYFYSNFHIRQKKCTFYDFNTNKFIQPQINQPNALKFELTYFDAIPFCPIQQFAIFKVNREDEYSAILANNNESKDNAQTARLAYMKRDQKWISKFGYDVKQDFEISPKLTYFGEGLEDQIKNQIKKNNQQIPSILQSEKQIRSVRVNSVHNQSPIKYQTNGSNNNNNGSATNVFQKISVHSSLNQLPKQQITSSLVTPNGNNQSFQLSGRKSIEQKPNRQTDYYQRPNLNQLNNNNKQQQYFINTYYLPKK